MYEVINSIGIPHELGFDIIFKTFESFFDTRQDKKEFLKKFNGYMSKVVSNYRLSPLININAYLTIASYDRKKCVQIGYRGVIRGFYEFFNGNYEADDLVYFNQSDLEEKEMLDDAIRKLKIFLREKIRALDKVNTIEDLKDISRSLYENFKSTPGSEIVLKEKIQSVADSFRRINAHLNDFISETTKPLPEEIFNKMNQDKLKMFLSLQYISLSIYFKEPLNIILIDASIKYMKAIKDKNVIVKDMIILKPFFDEKDKLVDNYLLYENFSYTYLTEIVMRLLKLYPEWQKRVDMISSYNQTSFEGKSLEEIRNFIKGIIEKGIELSKENGAQDIELTDRIEELREKAKKKDIKVSELRRIRTEIERLSMVLKEIKPDKTQLGAGKFKGFYVYYYASSGMVAIDKKDAVSGLYIMPISVYIALIENRISNINNLYDIRKVAGVTFLMHGKASWVDEAKEIILSRQITPEEMQKYDEILSISFPGTLAELYNLEKKYQDNDFILEEIDKRKKDIITRGKELDEEVRNTPSKENLSDKEREEIYTEEEELIQESNGSNDLFLLHDIAKEKGYHVRRNPAVSLKTKLRTLDNEGMMHCDFCDNKTIRLDMLDAHHIIPISTGGVDNVYNTACLCPSCHRMFHSKMKPTTDMRNKLLTKVRERIINSDIEYLSSFDKLFLPSHYAYDGKSDEELDLLYQKENEEYLENKEREDDKFAFEWNSHR